MRTGKKKKKEMTGGHRFSFSPNGMESVEGGEVNEKHTLPSRCRAQQDALEQDN